MALMRDALIQCNVRKDFNKKTLNITFRVFLLRATFYIYSLAASSAPSRIARFASNSAAKDAPPIK